MAERYLNLIGEEWVPARSGETFEDRNPARWSELLGTFPRSGPEEVAGECEPLLGHAVDVVA